MTAAAASLALRRRLRLRRRSLGLYLQFALWAGLALALAGGVSLWLSRGDATRSAQQAVWREAAFMADRLGRDDLARTALVRPAVGNEQLLLDDLFGQAAVAPGIVRVSLFQTGGTVTYSSDHALIGTTADRPDLIGQAVEHGSATTVTQVGGRQVIASFVPVHWLFSPDGRPSGVLAVYRDYRPVAAQIADDLRVKAVSTALGLLLLYAAMFPILRRVTRTLADRNRRLAAQADELGLLAAIVESTDDAVVGADAEGRIVSWNAGAERTYGWSAAEALGRPLSLLVPEGGEPVAAGAPNRLTVHGRRDGRRIDVSVTVSELPGGGTATIARDVGERLELERRVRRTQRAEAVGRLAGGVAHDFNNLLTGIGSFAELAAARLPQDAESRWYVEEIRKATARGAALTGQLVAFEGRHEARPQVLDLNAVVDATLPMLRRLLGEDVRLLAETQAGVLRVEADPSRLEQLVVGLVLNARDAIDRSGSIAVRTAADGDRVLLEVVDSGAHAGARHGLELAALWELVRGTGGTIGAEAEPGVGTTVRVSLPLSHGLLAEPELSEPPLEPAAAATGTVLLVEDEEVVRAVVREVLETAGYTVVAAHHGRQALELVESHEGRIDVVVSDVVMPELGGLELAEQVRRTHPGIGVVLMSGYPDASLGLDGSPTRMLTKPFSHADLLGAVAAAGFAGGAAGGDPADEAGVYEELVRDAPGPGEASERRS